MIWDVLATILLFIFMWEWVKKIDSLGYKVKTGSMIVWLIVLMVMGVAIWQ